MEKEVVFWEIFNSKYMDFSGIFLKFLGIFSYFLAFIQNSPSGF